MEKKRRPFTEKEDQTIILCLTKATSPNISDVMRKASTLTGRSFQSCYQRWIQLGKPTLEKLKEQEQEFEDWKLVHQFYYGEQEYIKSWINSKNYSNLFKKDWEALIDLVEKIEKLGYFVMINKWTSIYTGKIERVNICTIENHSKKFNTYYACIGFVKYWNNLNKKK